MRLFGSFRALLILGAIGLLLAACAPPSRDDLSALLDRASAALRQTVSGAGAPAGSSAGAAPAASGQTLVFLDPGHGAVDTGAVGTTTDGRTVEEKTIALAIAQRTADILRRDGIGVALARSDDSLPGATPSDYTADRKHLTPEGTLADLQRRIDRANASGARVMLSIHLNAFSDPSTRGTETFYDSARPFAGQSRRFATLVQATLIADLRAHGYATPDRGVVDDGDLESQSFGTLGAGYDRLVILGPGVAGRLRPSQMPAALCEALFLTNPAEATAVARPDVQDLIAASFTRAIEEFLGESGR